MTLPSPAEFDAQRRVPGDSPAEVLRRAWREGQEPALDQFVAKLNDLSPSDLAELIQIDLELAVEPEGSPAA